tara:strand:- start:443 stop:712 length:270 start_codon:yes stop_codon:yes gene_type:complete
MITREMTITNKLGLHARAASKFVAEAQKFAAEISVSNADKSVDGKRIMSMMMLAATQGTVISVSADGADESDALEALEALLASKFGEDE